MSNETAFELKQFQIIDEIAFDKTQAAQVIQLVVLKAQHTQRFQFALEIFPDVRQRINGGLVAAAELIHAVRLRELVQHDLQHGEFV